MENSLLNIDLWNIDLANPWLWTASVSVLSFGLLLYFSQSLARQYRGYHRLRADLFAEQQLLHRGLARVLPPEWAASLLRGEDIRSKQLKDARVVRIRNRAATAGSWLRIEVQLRRLGCYPAQHLAPNDRLYYYLPAAGEPASLWQQRSAPLLSQPSGLEVFTATGPAELRIEAGLLPALHLSGAAVSEVVGE